MNAITVAGYLTKDPELRQISGENQVANCSIAINERRGGEDHTIFLNLSVWGKRGATFAQFMKKGSFAVVSGKLIVRDYQNKEGQDRKDVGINVTEFSFGPKTQQSGGGGSSRPDTAPSGSFGNDEQMPF
jgi:single-strand DNA-binding protein